MESNFVIYLIRFMDPIFTVYLKPMVDPIPIVDPMPMMDNIPMVNTIRMVDTIYPWEAV